MPKFSNRIRHYFTLLLTGATLLAHIGAQAQLNTDFPISDSNNTAPIPVTLIWQPIPQADAYKVQEITPHSSEFTDKMTIFAQENTSPAYSFELPRPTNNAQQTWQFRVIGCLQHHQTLEILCESVARYSNPISYTTSPTTGTTPVTPVRLEISFHYDELGRLIEVIDPNNGDRHFQYDAAGNRTTVEVSNNGQ